MKGFQLGSDLSKKLAEDTGVQFEGNSKYSIKDTSKGIEIHSSQTGKVLEISKSLPNENVEKESIFQSMSDSTDKWKNNAKRAKLIYNIAISICIISTLISFLIINIK